MHTNEKMAEAIPFRERISCTVVEACVATGLGRTTVYKLIKERRIAAKKVGRRTVILVPTLLAEIEAACAK
jgi:excisionase family DNA binding protein